MYLKSLELHGFKSFPNRTVLTFERGVTVVVGPNGSGKSNISDAMRWVLGEMSSKSIRGTKMEDVIFGGTDDRRPMGFAEVSVTFDNTDASHRIDTPYDEITVTRRYYRAGESEYLINRKPVRLKDIHELFLNTGIGREGYSIIGQGRVAEMLSRKSEDRRNIFEEAAGISKFRYKKQEAERKLADTESNMVRVRDILAELSGRVEPLARDAEKAKIFLALAEEKKVADVSLWLYDTVRMRTELAEAEKAFKLSENELSIISESIADMEAQSDRLYDETQKSKLISEDFLRRIKDATDRLHVIDNALHLSDSEEGHIAALAGKSRERILELDRLESEAKTEKSDKERLAESTEREIAELMDARLEILALSQKLTAAIAELEKSLETSLSELETTEHHAVDMRVRIDMLKKSKESGKEKGEGLLRNIEAYEKEGERLAEEASRCEKNAEGFRLRIEKAEKEAALAQEKENEIMEAHTALTEESNARRIEREALLRRAQDLRRMEEQLEGYSGSVRFVMKEYEAGRLRGGKIFGPLSKLITVEDAHVVAIETALGAGIQNIVVENEDTAKAAIAALKSGRAGRATFYPLTSMKASSEMEETRRAKEMQGFIGRADTLVSANASFRELIGYLLNRTVVFDNIDHASVAAKALRYKIRIVTLDGQVINAGGSYTGGSLRTDSGMLSRGAQIDSLTEKADGLAKQIAEDEKRLESLKKEADAKRNERREQEQQKELLLTMSRAQFAALDSAKAKLDANSELLAKIKEDYDAIDADSARANDEIAELAQRLARLEKRAEEIRAFRSEQEVLRHATTDERDSANEKANEMSVSLAEKKKDAEAAHAAAEQASVRIADIRAERENKLAEIKNTELSKADILALREQNKKEYAKIEGELAELNKLRDEAEQDTSDFERRTNELRNQLKDKNSHKELCLRAHTKNEHKLSSLQNESDKLGTKLWDEYEMTCEQAMALDYPHVTAETRPSVVQTQSTCRAKIKALGSVNVAAIEEYEEVRTRYETLSVQVDDMNRSYEELTGIVSRIEEEMKNSFVSTFNEINSNFGTVFAELFGGGTAELSLSDPENVLTSGIEIKAAPPGKIIKSLSLLSGGEQAFVAIALFFSILKVNPTPFCILDEIEAALDEVNVFRFGEYVKKYSGETQFVLITHRRGTMEVADRLYGVTMPERGISRALPLQVSEIETRKKELLGDGILN